jgi:hypothetical protein
MDEVLSRITEVARDSGGRSRLTGGCGVTESASPPSSMRTAPLAGAGRLLCRDGPGRSGRPAEG